MQKQTLAELLGCPCTEFPSMKDPSPILDAYYAARKRGAQEGFFPMLLSGEASFLDSIGFKREGSAEEYRRKLLAEPVMDGKAVLDRLAAQHQAEAEEDGYPWLDGDLVGEMEGGNAVETFLGISNYHGGTIPLVLAELPVKNPWEVFAWLPFGGWNECPSDEEQMAAAKYWFEKYGAVPAVMTDAVLEYDLPAPVKREEAMGLAMEQFIFCADIVEQGCGSIGCLADILAKSTKWFFWWD